MGDNTVTKAAPKINNIEVKLNRLNAQKTALETKQKMHNKQQRRIRTRTLIQLGGLLAITKIPDRFDIEIGDELQIDLENKDKASTLLGLLLTVMDQLPETFSDSELNDLKIKGIAFMRKQ